MRTPSPRPRPGRLRHARRLAALALALIPTGCPICPPKADRFLDLGFRSPEQTFLTFQTGVAGDLPRLEYACLSAGFRSRNDLSQLVYREFRDQELGHWARLGIVDAVVERREDLGPRAARLVCSSHGRRFELSFVREDFAQAYSGERLLHDELLDDRSEGLGEAPREDGGRDLFAGALLPPGSGDEAVTELRVGSEWKIDDLPRELEAPPPTPTN